MRHGPTLDATLATFADHPGGVWRHIVDVASGLAERGVAVAVAVPEDAEPLIADARARGLTLRSLDDTQGDVWHVHLHDTLDRRAMKALARRKATRQATIATEHLPRTDATDPTLLPGGRTPGAHAAKTALKRGALAVTGHTILVSAASAAFLRQRYRVGGRRMHVVPNALRTVDGAAPGPPEPSADGLVEVIAVGSLIMQKGIDVLIDAASGATGWRAVVVGSGPHREALEARAAERGAPVRFAGWSDDVHGAMAKADVFCLPSRWEACPYVVLEAMTLGRPVVASAVDGVPEQVADGETGVLVPPEDPGALRAALDALAADRDARERLGAAAIGAIAARHRFDDMIDRTLAVYAAAAGRG